MKSHRRHYWRSAVIGVVAAASTIGVYHVATQSSQEAAPVSVTSATKTDCDSSLWVNVYHPDRLPKKDDCRTVTGIVQWDKIEPDGDYHIRLQLDDPNSAPVNDKNIGGYLVVEPICQMTPTQSDATGPCSTYKGPRFPLLRVGAHIQITGFYTLDKEHGWYEIHTVSQLKIL